MRRVFGPLVLVAACGAEDAHREGIGQLPESGAPAVDAATGGATAANGGNPEASLDGAPFDVYAADAWTDSGPRPDAATVDAPDATIEAPASSDAGPACPAELKWCHRPDAPDCAEGDTACGGCATPSPEMGCDSPTCTPCGGEVPLHAIASCTAGQCSHTCLEPYESDGNGGCRLRECGETGWYLCGGGCKPCPGGIFPLICCTESGACRSISAPAGEQCKTFG